MHSGSLLSTPISQHTHTEIANQSSVFISCRDWMSSFSTSQNNVPGNQLDLVHSIKCACHPRFNLKGVFFPPVEHFGTPPRKRLSHRASISYRLLSTTRQDFKEDQWILSSEQKERLENTEVK